MAERSVLISIRPQWCEKIANGIKTIEVRKTRPKLETPFKCYIYCTNTTPYLVWGDVFRGNWETEFTHLTGYNRKDAERIWDVFNGRVMGEFVCDSIFAIETNFEVHDEIAGSPVEAWLEWNDAPDGYESPEDIEKATCLSLGDIASYTKGSGYGWHISNLEIYDTPKELSEFRMPCKEYDKDNPRCGSCEYYYYESNESAGFYEECCCDGLKHITRPPQSWCYVKGGEGDG